MLDVDFNLPTKTYIDTVDKRTSPLVHFDSEIDVDDISNNSTIHAIESAIRLLDIYHNT